MPSCWAWAARVTNSTANYAIPFADSIFVLSGRQSLSRLASHTSELYLFQIELSKNYGTSDWRDDLKSIMLRSGLENRESVFLFSDTQVHVDTMFNVAARSNSLNRNLEHGVCVQVRYYDLIKMLNFDQRSSTSRRLTVAS